VNKQQLAAKIWESANQMRSKIEANEYKDYILGFIFYKYLSDKIERFAISQDFSREDIHNLSEEDQETVDFFKRNLGYFIAHEHLFSTWLELGGDFQVSNVRDALSAFSRLIHADHKRLFDGIFKTLETGLSKLGDTAAKQTKAISELIQLIKDIPMDGRQGYDVLGFIYEYLISMFAANAGKKAGEFYTPHEVSVLISEIIADHVKGKDKIDIYDSTSGSGSLLLNIGKSIAKHMGNEANIKYFAQELKENTYNLTRMNLIMLLQPAVSGCRGLQSTLLAKVGLAAQRQRPPLRPLWLGPKIQSRLRLFAARPLSP
jgi:type I restriction enzyme M protein